MESTLLNLYVMRNKWTNDLDPWNTKDKFKFGGGSTKNIVFKLVLMIVILVIIILVIKFYYYFKSIIDIRHIS